MSYFSREEDVMFRVPENSKSYRNREKSRICLYFCLGFVLSSLLTVVSCGLVYALGTHRHSENALVSSATVAVTSIPTNTTLLEANNMGTTPSTLSNAQRNCSKRVVGYYAIDEIEDIPTSQLSKLTHLILLPMVTLKDGPLTFIHESGNRIFLTAIENARSTPTKPAVLFTFLSLQFTGSPFAEILTNFVKTRDLVDGIVLFIQKYNLDGVEVYLDPVVLRSDLLIPFCRSLRDTLTNLATFHGRKTPYIISAQLLANLPSNMDAVFDQFDFLTATTIFGYYPRPSFPSHFVGPSSPLYSKLATDPNRNVDYCMRNFTCSTRQPNKLNMMVDFGVNYWKNVIAPVNFSDTLWMTAEYVNGKIEGGATNRSILSNASEVLWNDDSKTPYIWNPEERTYYTFENERSLEEKMKYIHEKNLGGIAIFHKSIERSVDALMDVVTKSSICAGNEDSDVMFKCN